MKFLLATYEYPPDLGGISAYLSGLFGVLPAAAFRVLKLNMPSGRLAWLWDLPRIWRASSHADVLIISHVLPLGTLAWLIGKPYVVFVHGLDLRRAAAHPRKKKLAARILSRAKLVVANSQATAEEVSVFGLDPTDALVLTPCPDGMLAEKGKTIDARAQYDLIGKKVLLSIGRFVPRKGFDRLIRLLPELRRSCGDVVLVVAGAGVEEGRLRNEAALSGVEPHVRFVIGPDRETLAALYRAADLFALAVRDLKDDVEGFGLVFLEAALFGLPSVGTRVGGVAEAVLDERTGLLADPDSEHDLYEKLRRLLLDPAARKRLGQAGRDRVATDFRWEARFELFLNRLA